jgi:hypothetical protein
VAVGIGLALTSNLVRTVFLSWQGATHGESGVARWHDPAGYALLVVTFGSLILVYLRWARQPAALRPPAAPPAPAVPIARPDWIATLAVAFSVALVAVEIGTQIWYGLGDRATREAPQLVVRLPTADPTFATDPFTSSMQSMLLCDDHQLGHWMTGQHVRCSAYLLHWRTGQAARSTPTFHNPAICLPSSGSHLVSARGLVTVPSGTLLLPFKAYLFATERETMHVYYLAWDVRSARSLATGASAPDAASWICQQWGEVRAARRSFEAQVVALAFYDAPSDRAADEALRHELARIISP